ncbi:MAG: DinB family protein [Acidobacteria bacterium]|nr:DinB family protein [Acidobacteriota bacterium]
MHQRQVEQMETLEKLRSELLGRLSDSNSETLNREPAAGGWSAVQVLAHVIQAERLSLEYLRKKTQRPELIPSSGVIAALKSRALGLFLRLPFKVSAPARTAEVPESAELQDLERDWAEVRSAWRDFLEDFPPKLAGKAVYKHPVAGRLNLEQTLRFLIDHLRRHTRQIERALVEGLAP